MILTKYGINGKNKTFVPFEKPEIEGVEWRKGSFFAHKKFILSQKNLKNSGNDTYTLI